MRARVVVLHVAEALLQLSCKQHWSLTNCVEVFVTSATVGDL